MAISSFERVPLLFGPAPIQPLERLTRHLGGAAVWAKRDDCNSGIAFGGNKTRKLEYLAADAIATGCDTLVSIGGVQSNHTRQVAAVAAHLGLGCVLVQESWEQALADVHARGGKPYAIPAGASDHRLGGLGYANWALEVATDEARLGVFFDTIVVCSVTGSTQAGMIAGFAALADAGGRPRRVLGIDASAKPAETRAQVARIARATADLIGLGRDLRDDEIELDERYHGGIYGIPDSATLDAMRLVGRLEGVVTDPVYEGKSMAALIDLVGRGEIGADSTVLFAHLGGQPALNGYSALFR